MQVLIFAIHDVHRSPSDLVFRQIHVSTIANHALLSCSTARPALFPAVLFLPVCPSFRRALRHYRYLATVTATCTRYSCSHFPISAPLL